MLTLGLDEAGRGPVIGPLVIGAVMVDSDEAQQLEAWRVADSKQLSRPHRHLLYERIIECMAADWVEIPATALDENLTTVEMGGLADLINKHKPDRVVLDAPVPPKAIPGFVERLESALDFSPDIVAENKADENYPVVSAASIIAKVRRDRAMLQLHQHYGDIGWGYPGEAKTQEFLRSCASQGGFPPCVRTKWATVQRLKQHSLFD